MGFSVERLVRDRLVNDATIRGFFGAAITSSARVYPNYIELSAQYPQILYSDSPGDTDPGMSACNGSFALSIEAQATGGVMPYRTINDISERADQLFDDQSVTGLAVSGTSVYTFLVLREGMTPIAYNDSRKVYQRFVNYSYKVIKY